MTRREEIEKVAHEFYKGDEVSTFVVAAQWADRTLVDKAIQWLFENVYDYLNPEDQERVSKLDEFLFPEVTFENSPMEVELNLIER